VVGVFVGDRIDQTHESVAESLGEVLDVSTLEWLRVIVGAIIKPVDFLAIQWLVIIVDGPLFDD
jgi:hypothetical protein